MLLDDAGVRDEAIDELPDWPPGVTVLREGVASAMRSSLEESAGWPMICLSMSKP
jgi:hypothetical protein